jgi:hypothetical protein
MSDELASSEAWPKLKANMLKSLFTCEGMAGGDGIRLMHSIWDEWLEIN